jgi:hypothetical protein
VFNGRGGAVDVVVVAHDRVGDHARRHTGGRRDTERGEARAGACEELVCVTVVTTRELEHAVTVRESAGEPHRAHRRLGAGRNEPHAFDRRNRVDDLGREQHLTLGRGAERRPVERSLAHGLDRYLVRMAEEQRAPRLHPVDQGPAVRRLEVRAAPAADEKRLVEPDASHRAHGRVDAARDQPERPMPERRPD